MTAEYRNTSPLGTGGGYLHIAVASTSTYVGMGVDGTKPVTFAFSLRLDAANSTFLVGLYGLSTTIGDINNADTVLWLRRMLNLMFTQFPQLDGIFVRIGETYLNDAPYHQGKIDNKTSASLTITPLIIVEVQCAREYEGKGAFPNYIANGVIEGFEEYAANPSQSLRNLWQNSPLMRGVWTWSRGGGWRGPFIKNELWSELNAWVMAQWALDPAASEEPLFNCFATEKLGLPASQIPAFRRLALLSAKAAWRWKRGTVNSLVAGWSRDEYYTYPNLPGTSAAVTTMLALHGSRTQLELGGIRRHGRCHRHPLQRRREGFPKNLRNA